jgi:vanillate O-demethylase ferredoxin subunit
MDRSNDDAKAQQLRLTGISYVTGAISLFEFQAPDGGPLPAFKAGAHIGIELTPALTRQYSLVNAEDERHRYVVGVKREAQGRGGSIFMHDKLRVGAVYNVLPPRNNFALDEAAEQTVLFAGGIGITPIYCMVQRLESLGRNWRLYYAAQTREQAAFTAELRKLGDRVHLHIDAEADGKFLDLPRIVATVPEHAHLYCCGPKPMLAAFESAVSRRPPAHAHVEYFVARADMAAAGGFVVELARSGRQLAIPPGRTILEVLLESGMAVQNSCQQGICGMCETRIISGIPDHRDSLLTEQERAANAVMMVCCSGALSDRLVLDL